MLTQTYNFDGYFPDETQLIVCPFDSQSPDAHILSIFTGQIETLQALVSEIDRWLLRIHWIGTY